MALDNEGFTYNHKVNPLTAIQEHFMILEAIRHGISEERFARRSTWMSRPSGGNGMSSKASVRRRFSCSKRNGRPTVLSARCEVRSMRQIQMAKLMLASNNFSANYAQCLFAATPTNSYWSRISPRRVGEPAPRTSPASSGKWRT